MNKLDTVWYEKYIKCGLFDDIVYLKPEQGSLEEEKARFISGIQDNPVFKYDLPVKDLDSKRIGLENLRVEIVRDEENEAVCDAYVGKIDEQLLKLDMLNATKGGDDQKFFEISKDIYGVPGEENLKKGLATILAYAKDANLTPGKVLSDLGEELGVTHNDRVEGLHLEKPTGKRLNTNEIVDVFTKALKKESIDWSVVVDKNASQISVQYYNSQIVIPDGRMDYESVIKGLVEHEVGVHLKRYKNGKNSPLEILSLGLDKYLSAEEGLTSYYERKISKSYSPGGMMHIAVALASGVGVRKPWSFREVHGFLCDYYTMMCSIRGYPDIQDVPSEAWRRTLRVFRGTQNTTGGACFTRDHVYWKGYMNISKMIKGSHPETSRMLVGKYDPLNKNHTDILDKVGL